MPNSALTGLHIDPRATHMHLQRMQDSEKIQAFGLDPKAPGGMGPSGQARGTGNPKLDAAAQDFEAMFMAEVIRPMFDSIEIDERFGGGKGEEIFRGMLADEYGKIMSASGGIGLASPVKQALINAQGLKE